MKFEKLKTQALGESPCISFPLCSEGHGGNFA